MKKECYSLIGIDGNAYSIMGYVVRAMDNEDKTEAEVDKFLAEAKSGDYENLVCVALAMINTLNEERLRRTEK